MACSEILTVVSCQIYQCERERMKICKVCTYGLKPEIGGGRKSAVEQVHQDVFRRLKRLVLAAGFDEKLLCQDQLNLPPDFRRDILQVAVRIHADKVSEPDARTDQRCEAAPERASLQLHKICLFL